MAGMAPSTPHVGTLLADRYALVRHLARGGMGDVYEGEDQLLRRPVAVKVFRTAGPADRTRFDAEVRVLAGLNHPGLVRVFDAGRHGEDAYLVLELVDGPPLAESLRRRSALPSDEVARLGADLADALAYIHRHGVVHRDVTLRNVLCGPDGRPRLVDFGIARLLESPRITAVDTTVGTAAFMAPEQVQGKDVTPAADVYALGLVLLEALTARRAFDGPPHEAAAARLVRDPDTTTGVPGAWHDLLGAMTARDPGRRPTALEVRDRLVALATAAGEATAAVPAVAGAPRPVTAWGEEATQVIASADHTAVLAAPPLVAEPEPGPAVRGAPPGGRRGLWVALAGVAALVVAVAVAVAATQSPPEEPTQVTTIPPATTAPPADTEEAPPTTDAPVTTVPETLPPTTTVPEVIPVEPVPEAPPAENPPVVDAPAVVDPAPQGAAPGNASP
jgi:eukaryotic-like serine/threonine-protein kinase